MTINWKRQFATIYAGQAFSLLGSAAVQFALIWWLTVREESAIVLSIATLILFVPNMILGPFIGIWIDRFNRKKIMIAADALIALTSVVVGIIFLASDAPSVGFVYAILFFRGLGNTFHGPALQAAIPMLVPTEMLTKAGGWGNLVVSISNMLGPVLGAGLMAAFSIASIMLVDIFGALFAIISLLFVHIPDIPTSTEKPEYFKDLKQGFMAIRDNKPLFASFGPLVLLNILYMPLGALFPLLVKTHFLGDSWHNGVVEFVFAGGLLVSSLIIGVWGGMKKRFLMGAYAIALLGAATMFGGMLPPGGFWIFVFLCFFMGASGTFMNVPLMAYTQESTPPEMMGKVFSLLMAAMTLAMPIGLLFAGPISEAIGVDAFFFWSGVALVANAVLFRLLTRAYDAETRLPEAAFEQTKESVEFAAEFIE